MKTIFHPQTCFPSCVDQRSEMRLLLLDFTSCVSVNLYVRFSVCLRDSVSACMCVCVCVCEDLSLSLSLWDSAQ